jgi:hypothetical protein
MQYYSHVLHFPERKPFDRPDSAYWSFLGELVLPVVRLGLHRHFWFTNYGNHARFRVYTDQYDRLRPTLEARRDALGLVDRGEEKDLTLVGDLGHDRFLARSRTDKQPEDRALLVLRYLHAIAELVCDNLQQTDEGYWTIEQSMNQENPNGSNFESLHHLLCNSAKVPLFVHMSLWTEWMSQPVTGKVPVGY